MTLRNAWEKRAYEAEAALAAAEPPRGKVSVLAPPYPRKDLAALEERVNLRKTIEAEHAKAKKLWRTLKPEADAARYQYWAGFCDAMAFCGAEVREKVAPDELEQRLAEMRGAGR